MSILKTTIHHLKRHDSTTLGLVFFWSIVIGLGFPAYFLLFHSSWIWVIFLPSLCMWMLSLGAAKLFKKDNRIAYIYTPEGQEQTLLTRQSWILCFCFGPFYYFAKGMYKHAVMSFFTLNGLGAGFPLFNALMVSKEYRRRGYEIRHPKEVRKNYRFSRWAGFLLKGVHGLFLIVLAIYHIWAVIIIQGQL